MERADTVVLTLRGIAVAVIAGSLRESAAVATPPKRSASRRALIATAAREANEELANHPRRETLGFCHIFWATQQRILKDKYGIEWKTPAEEDPDTLYD